MDRLKIEREYLDGHSERTIAETYGISDSAIHRHAIGTDLNRLRQTDSEIFYLRVIHAAEVDLARGVTARDGLRAAEQLDRLRGVEKGPDKRRQEAERVALLDERVAFGIEAFKRQGVTMTRRDLLEMFSNAPESAGGPLSTNYG